MALDNREIEFKLFHRQ